MTRRVVAKPEVFFADVADVPPGVELCRDDSCQEQDLHAVHRASRRGQKAKTWTCPTCLVNVPAGAPCATCSSKES